MPSGVNRRPQSRDWIQVPKNPVAIGLQSLFRQLSRGEEGIFGEGCSFEALPLALETFVAGQIDRRRGVAVGLLLLPQLPVA